MREGGKQDADLAGDKEVARRGRSRTRCQWFLAAVLPALMLVPATASAATLQLIGTVDRPIYVTSDPANPDRLFVVERGGLIRLVQGAQISTFADLRPVVQCCEGERGLLSIAFPPDFPRTPRFYVDYTGKDGPGNLHVAELTASGNSASISSLRNLLTIGHSQATNHNGGQLQFGPDGYLYVSTGDAASGANAQNLNSLLGKVLRIDPRQNGSAPYTVPQGNPFVGVAGRDEIWAYGLRNPWRFSFDRARGDLLLTDVGQSNWEEANYSPLASRLGRSANFGWNCREGAHPFGGAPSSCFGRTGFTDPVFEYAHTTGGCSIIGGYVARDPSLGDLYGRYVYADLCLGQLRSFIPRLPSATGDRSENLFVGPWSFGEDSCGRIYVAAGDGNVYRLAGTAAPNCAVLRRGRLSGRGTVQTTIGPVQFSVATACIAALATGPSTLGSPNGSLLWTKTAVTGSSCFDQPPTSSSGFDTQAGTATGLFGAAAPGGRKGQRGTLQWTYRDGGPDTVGFTLYDSFGNVVLRANPQTPTALGGKPGGIWTRSG